MAEIKTCCLRVSDVSCNEYSNNPQTNEGVVIIPENNPGTVIIPEKIPGTVIIPEKQCNNP
jgi:hypothetical protein